MPHPAHFPRGIGFYLIYHLPTNTCLLLPVVLCTSVSLARSSTRLAHRWGSRNTRGVVTWLKPDSYSRILSSLLPLNSIRLFLSRCLSPLQQTPPPPKVSSRKQHRCGLHCSTQDSTTMHGSSHRLSIKSRHGCVPMKQGWAGSGRLSQSCCY